MEILLFMLAFALPFKLSSCVQCIKCVPEEQLDGVPVCKHFEDKAADSSKFLVDCEHSTMCFKRQTTLHLGNGLTAASIERGCAAQTKEGDQAKVNGKWRSVNTIYEVYEEGCKESDYDTERPTKTVNCYCRGHLCNSSSIPFISLEIIPIIFFLFSYL